MSGIEKGKKVKIIGGKDAGNFGEVFWLGENKFGDGMRAGVKGIDGETYWVDEELLEEVDTLPDAPEKPKPSSDDQNAFGKGDRVEVVKGKEKGAIGEIFWWGESKFGDGMRAGLKTADDETVWAAGHELKALESSGDEKPTPNISLQPTSDEPAESFEPSSDEPSWDDVPLPEEPPEFADAMSLDDVMNYESEER